MRTYDPADRIVYVHLDGHPDGPLDGHPARRPAPPVAAQPAPEDCHRLPAGYPNASLRAPLGEPGAVPARPALVLLPGGSAAADGPGSAARALRLAR